MATEYGGYDFNFVEEPSTRYSCAVCKLVSCDPQQSTCCHNTFCKSCIRHLRRSARPSQPSCPLCQETLHSFNDGKLNREIMGLKVYCTNSEEGCEWQGTIGETGTTINTHLNSCPYQPIPCTNDCGEEIRRESLGIHLIDSCTKRMSNCQYCNRRGRYDLVTSSSHLEECPDLPIQCSNEGCNEMILRRCLASHNETCPKATIPCDYNTVGCHKIIKREEQDSHNQISVSEHLQLTQQQLLKLATDRINRIEIGPEVFACVLKRFNDSETWYSPGFYTKPFRYKMSLLVYPNGKGSGVGTHVSCFVCIMAGEYDEALEWPFVGEVTIELLNQLENKTHKKWTISFNDKTPKELSQKVEDGGRSEGWGIEKFISHKELDNSYLKSNSLYFRVYVQVKRPW